MGKSKQKANSIISKRLLVNSLLIGGAWILIIFGGRFYFSKYTHHGTKVDVPNLLDNNVQDIPTLIGDRKLDYEIIDSVYNPDLLEGTVIYQNPMPTDSTGLMVKENRLIRVRVSKRSRLVTIPNVVSKSERFATAVLMSKGLRTKVRYVSSNEDQGSVIEQKFQGKNITSDQSVPINSVIELTVGKRSFGDMVRTPNLVGLTINEAQQRFEGSSNLKLYLVCSGCATSEDSLNARVLRQTPVATDSSMVPEGSTITIFASPKEFEEENLNN